MNLRSVVTSRPLMHEQFVEPSKRMRTLSLPEGL